MGFKRDGLAGEAPNIATLNGIPGFKRSEETVYTKCIQWGSYSIFLTSFTGLI